MERREPFDSATVPKVISSLLEAFLLCLRLHSNVQHFREDGERHREVDKPLLEVDMEPFGNQGRADEKEEGKREDLHRGMAADEAAYGSGKNHHEADRNHHGDDHDRDVIDHADGGDDGVERKDDVEHRDLYEDGPERRFGSPGIMFGLGMPFDLLVEFRRAFPEEEEASQNKDEILTRNGMRSDRKEWLLQLHNPGDAEEQQYPGHHREGEAEKAGLCPLRFGQFVHEDGDKDDVVDSQHDLHDGERQQGDPGFRAVDPREVKSSGGDKGSKIRHAMQRIAPRLSLAMRNRGGRFFFRGSSTLREFSFLKLSFAIWLRSF